MTTPPRGQSLHPLPPADPTDLAHFPHREVQSTWFRAHVDRGGRDHGCWWFASAPPDPDTGGRFDLAAPHGTCYLASTDEAAARERVGTQLRRVAGSESVTASALATPDGPVVVTSTQLTRLRAANLPVKPAQRWVDRSLSVGTGIYAVSQAWAAAFHAAGFGGIVHEPRFTAGARVRALALFGRAGRPRPLSPILATRPLREVLEQHGVRIVSPPQSAPRLLGPEQTPPAL